MVGGIVEIWSVLPFEKIPVVIIWGRGGREAKVSDRKPTRRPLSSPGKEMVLVGCKLVEG